MSDYAGSILQVGGAIVSIWYPPVGRAIMAAGAVLNAYAASQEVIPGPKIGDVQKQTSQEGGFRPIVFGRSHPIMGNVIADGGPIIVPEEPGGKGGPKQGKGESAYRTYAIGFCEGEAELLQAWRNGILVYDAENPSMAAANAKFLQYATWYNGSFAQSAAPELEAIYGVGQAPYFRGTAYLSLDQEDTTDQRGAWSQWHVRVFRGAAKSYTTPPYAAKYADSVQIAFTPTGGSLEDIVQYGGMSDEMSIAFTPTGGELVDAGEGRMHDEIDISFEPIGGVLKDAPVGALAPDEIDIEFTPTGGVLKDAPTSDMSDEISIAFTPTGGSLSDA